VSHPFDGVGSMRYLCILALLLVPSVAVAGERLTPRPLDPITADALARALTRSAVVRSLVATLEASDVIVHIESSRLMPAGIAGTTRFVTTRGGYRYVRVTIGADLPRDARVAILGHELQHACEVAQSEADDVEGLRQMFLREGSHDGDYFETERAVEIERMVRLELRASHLPARSAVPGK
jgi:hypothetical protein